MAEVQRFVKEHGKQIAEVQRFTNEHAKLMAALGEPGPVLAQMAEVRRAVNRANAFRVRFTSPT
jgi:hypothetical protein